jgi:SAM-dependent methyltransferase
MAVDAAHSCPVCGGGAQPFATRERNGERWTGYACAACDSQYWHPREIRPEYYADPEQELYDRRRSGEAFLRERHRLFLARARPGRLFDIGCGEGAFLAEASARGFEVAGIDLDAGMVEVARSRGLRDVSCGLLMGEDGALSPALERGGRFDWITAFEVLEHQADVLGFLRAAARMLAPGGRLCGSVPNRDRLFAARKRRDTDGDWPPHHFFWFSQRSLATTLARGGFPVAEVMPVPEPDLWGHAASFEAAVFGPLRRRARLTRPGARTAAPGTGGLAGRVIRRLKDAPFVPLALAVKTALPRLGRALYFEASAG